MTTENNHDLAVCRNGHPLTSENLYFPPGKAPTCRECNRLSAAKYKAKKFGREFVEGRSKAKADALMPKPFEELFEYCEKSPTGLVWRITTAARSQKGEKAGSMSGTGYYAVRRLGKNILCHRIVWELHNGPIPEGMVVDHVNGIPTDNRIENLRLATRAQNVHNQRMRRDNTSGVKGLSRHGKIWAGGIRSNGERYGFASKSRSEVEAWLLKTRKEVHGEFAKHITKNSDGRADP